MNRQRGVPRAITSLSGMTTVRKLRLCPLLIRVRWHAAVGN
jgi:hypothetical protein